MHLALDGGFVVSDIVPADKGAFLVHLREKEIYDRTLAIPYPYTEADADFYIGHVAEEAARQGRSVNWAIRREDGHLIGGIGFHDLVVGTSHRAEIGYWLAKPWWNQGLMTKAVRAVSAYGFRELGLARIAANVFHDNLGSARVLEKAGFRFEGILRKHYRKAGTIFDGRLYAKIDDDP